MAFQVVTQSKDVPRPTRTKRRTLESTDDWLQFKAKLAEGLKPYEIVVVSFTAQDREKYDLKTIKRVFRDMAKKYIKTAKLPYEVDAYSSEGVDVITVKNEPVMTKAKQKAS